MQHKQVAAFLQLLLEVNDTLNDFSPMYGFWKVPQEHWQNLKQKACAMAQLHVQLSERYSGLGVSLSSTSLPKRILLCIRFSWPRVYTHH